MKIFNLNDFRRATEKKPEELTEEEHNNLQDYIKQWYETDSKLLNMNRVRIAEYEDYSLQMLTRINKIKRIAYKFGLEITK